MMFTAYSLDGAMSSQYKYESLEYYRNRSYSVNLNGEDFDIEVIDGKWGEEGDYQCDTFVVFTVDGRTFKKTGRYASHDGEYWDGPLVEVTPVEKTVTVYEEKPVSADYCVIDVNNAVEQGDFYYWSTYYAERNNGDGWTSADGWSDLAYEGDSSKTKVDFGGVEHTWSTDDANPGREGGGEYAYVVVAVTDPSGKTRLFRKEGYYASHYGTDWDGTLSEVEVFEKTVKDYRPI